MGTKVLVAGLLGLHEGCTALCALGFVCWPHALTQYLTTRYVAATGRRRHII